MAGPACGLRPGPELRSLTARWPCGSHWGPLWPGVALRPGVRGDTQVRGVSVIELQRGELFHSLIRSIVTDVTALGFANVF